MKNRELESRLQKVTKHYRDIAVVELAFCSYIWMEEEKSPWLYEEYNLIKRMEEAEWDISSGYMEGKSSSADNHELIKSMKELRQEVTAKMELFTTYLERIICYKQVLNRIEWKYSDNKIWEKNVTKEKESKLIQKIMEYIVCSKDNAVMNDKIRTVVGQLPVRMMKTKFYERLKEVVNLYLGDEQFILDGFIYRIKSAGIILNPKEYVNEFKEFDLLIKKLDKFDFAHSDKVTFLAMQEELDIAMEKIKKITDFYYSVQEIISLIYAIGISNQYVTESSTLFSNAMKTIYLILKKEAKEDSLVPFEGVLEELTRKSYHHEKSMNEIEQLYSEALKNHDLEQQYKDIFNIAVILSKNLFVDFENEQNTKEVDKKYIEKVSEELVVEFEKIFEKCPKCVCRAIMARVIEQLPMMFKSADELRNYVEQSFFNCQDKAEKMAVMQALEGVIDDTLV